MVRARTLQLLLLRRATEGNSLGCLPRCCAKMFGREMVVFVTNIIERRYFSVPLTLRSHRIEEADRR